MFEESLKLTRADNCFCVFHVCHNDVTCSVCSIRWRHWECWQKKFGQSGDRIQIRWWQIYPEDGASIFLRNILCYTMSWPSSKRGWMTGYVQCCRLPGGSSARLSAVGEHTKSSLAATFGKPLYPLWYQLRRTHITSTRGVLTLTYFVKNAWTKQFSEWSEDVPSRVSDVFRCKLALPTWGGCRWGR